MRDGCGLHGHGGPTLTLLSPQRPEASPHPSRLSPQLPWPTKPRGGFREGCGVVQ